MAKKCIVQKNVLFSGYVYVSAVRKGENKSMERMKKGIAALLALAMCFSVMLPYAEKIFASDIRTDEEHTVTLKTMEGGKIRFLDSDEKSRVCRSGELITFEICPEEGFELEQVKILDADFREDNRFGDQNKEGQTESREENQEEDRTEDQNGTGQTKDKEESQAEVIQGASKEETKEEGSAGERITKEEIIKEEGLKNQIEGSRVSFVMENYDVDVYAVYEKKTSDNPDGKQPEVQSDWTEEIRSQELSFPYEGYVWGKDSRKLDTGLTARLTGGMMLRSAIGSDATIRPGTSHRYGGWSTHEYHVTTGTGQFLGYCAQPNLESPNGIYSISELDNTMIKAALLIAPGGVPQLYENYGKNIYNEADNNVYAYAHALIGYLYMGSLKGLTASMADGVKNMAAILSQVSHNPDDVSYGLFQDYLSQYKAYVAHSGSDSVQDIVWIEKGENPKGYAKLRKSSSNTEITAGNSCYSLAGAQYGVFSDRGCGTQVATLTTDESGNSDTASLDAGTYYVKEIKAARGYMLDSAVYTIQVASGQTAELKVSDEPVISPPLMLYKVDRETRDSVALGAASLDNTQFRVSFYRGYYTKDNLPAKADRTWVLRAGALEPDRGKNGRAAGNEEQYKVFGDAFYMNREEMMLPLGTIRVEEIQAPAGYQLDSIYLNSSGTGAAAEKFHIAKVVQNGNQGVLEDGREYVVADSVIRGDFELTKIDKNTQQAIAGVPFRITSNTTKESHIIMTDENGHYSSNTAYAAHSYQTNGGQAGNGLWFGQDENGNTVGVDDGVGALPYDTYRIEELQCAANEGKYLYSGTFTISRANYIVNLGNVENADIAIQTTARDEATGTHYAKADDVTIIDRVSYIGLQKNKKYRLEGTLMNRTTGRAVTDRDKTPIKAVKEFTPKDSNGEVEVEFFFDAAGLAGADVVVYEELYLQDKKLAEHKDINDSGQTIHFPRIGTRAVSQNTNSEIAGADEEMVIVDTVSYENLRVGRKYKVTGTLMDKKTGREVLDEKGSKVEAETEFTAERANGTVDVTFRFPGRNLAGKTLVAFESLERDGREYAVHHDITDEPQTVYVPKIGTSVRDNDTGSHIARADSEVTLVDEVRYENLVPHKEYVLKGTLIDRKTGKAAADAKGASIEAQVSFTPEEKDGSTEVVFRFDGRNLAGETLVVYEEMLYGGKRIAEHKEDDDEKQTIYFPSIETEASDQDTQERMSFAGQKVILEDVVHYKNLLPGKKYTISGILMDQETGGPILDAKGKEVTAEKEFTAKNPEGDETVVFEFDGSILAGKVTVAFEELFLEKKSIAVHTDIEDEPQTVRFPEIRTKAVDPETGINLTLAADEVTVTDTVSYRHLIPERQYHLEGMLMDQKTGEPALDANGNEIHADMDFVPEESEGSVELSFRFPGADLEGQTFVVFEELSVKKSWLKKVKVAEHKDIEDEAQTIHIPKLGTAAIDDETQTQQSMADEEINITDTVSYSNLLPGYEYTVRGILMDQETGEPVIDDGGNQVTAEKTFEPEDAEGTTDMEFSFSGKSLAGRTSVVFETLEYEKKPVAKHEDIEDLKQSIYFPKIGTTAADKADQDKELVIGGVVTITDRVEYRNLIPGMEYRMEGIVMDKAAKEPLMADGKPVTAERIFKPEKADGSIDVDFTFQSKGMKEQELVVFEKLFLYESGKEAAVHEDLEDEGQTVRLVKPQAAPKAVKTGDTDRKRADIYLALIAVSGVFIAFHQKRRNIRKTGNERRYSDKS